MEVYSKMRTILLVLICSMCLAGCSRLTGGYGLYPGVRDSCKVIRIEKSAFGTFAAISLPFDFVLDTVLLPRDAIRDMYISNEFVTVEFIPGPGNEEVWGFVATDTEMPETMIELNNAKAHNEYLKKVITKKQQLEIQNWFAYPGNSLAVERGCDKVLKFTKIE